MRNEYKMVCETPCYIDENNDSRENPYRLTVAVKEDGEVWLLAEGNGCGNDLILDEGDEAWKDMDSVALRENAAELLASGYEEAADWVLARAIDVELAEEEA